MVAPIDDAIANPKSKVQNGRRLLIVGDSISLGAVEVSASDVIRTISPSYVDLLRAAMPNVTIDVDADVRRTSAIVRDELDRLIGQYRPDVVLLFVGGSDGDMDWRRFVLSEGKIARSRTPVERYEKNLREICARLTAAGATPVLTDFHNHDFEIRGPYVSTLAGKDVTRMLREGGGQAESDKHLVHYRRVVGTIARDLDVDLIRYGEAMDAQDPKRMLSVDGTHPDLAGHRLIADAMIPALTRICESQERRLRPAAAAAS